MILKVTSEPAAEPVTATEAKYHLRMQGVTLDSDETAELASITKAARLMAENFTRRKLITQTVVGYMDDWEQFVTLGVSPVTAITSVKYLDTAGAEQTLATTEYSTDLVSANPRINFHGNLPDLKDDAYNRVYVTMTAGYGAASTNIPEDIRSAIKLIIGHLWENRQDVIVGSQVNKMPKSSEYLLFPYVVWV